MVIRDCSARKNVMELNNKYFLLRHGEAESNARNLCSSWPETFENHLTAHGKEQIAAAVEKLRDKSIDIIFCSPLLRTQETAEIVGQAMGVRPQIDERLREIGFGTYNGKSIEEFREYFKGNGRTPDAKVPGGESYREVQARIISFFNEINAKYKRKTVLIVSHQAPLLLLQGHITGHSLSESIEPLRNVFNEKRIAKGELIKIN